MDFIAEIVLDYADLLLFEKLNDLKLAEYRILKYMGKQARGEKFSVSAMLKYPNNIPHVGAGLLCEPGNLSA